MKKTIVLLMVITIILVVLSSCSEARETSETESLDLISSVSVDDSFENTISTVNSDTETTLPEYNAETIINDLSDKFDQYDYIVYGQMEHSSSDTADFIFNNISYAYYKVTDDKYKTTEDIKTLILSLYDESLTDNLYSELFGDIDGLYPSYVDIDGSLYIVKDFPGKSPGGEQDYKNATVTQNSDGTLLMTASFVPCDGTSHDFVITLAFDGLNWVISE